MAADFNPNVITGLASGMDTKGIIEQMMAANRKKVEPVIARKDEKQVELDTWKQVETIIKNVQTTSDVLSTKSLWEGKIVSSSNPDVVEAIATSGAKPGKHTIVVDKLALSHQIASQTYANKDDIIGRGNTLITIGEDQEFKFTIDETNDTVQGFVDAINALDADVSANIVKTGNKERPFQIVLTSKKTGLEGKIQVFSQFDESGEAPTFDPYYSQPGKWQGIKREDAPEVKPTGTGASTVVPELIGEYTGEDPIDIIFTAVNTGLVGVSENLKLRWEDSNGRFGYLDIGSFSYTPGEPIDVVDGIQLIMSDGEIIVNDTFTASAKNEESDLIWWKSEEERASQITQPSSWGRQATEGGPIITGTMDSEDDDFFTLKVVGTGQIGQAEDLRIEYESENGIRGTAFIGKGYQPSSKLSLGHGLEISLNPGILQDGDYATFEYQADSTADYWWLDESEQHEGGLVTDVTNWITPEVEDEEEGIEAVDKPKPVGARVSNAEKAIVGKYSDYDSKLYTFTVLKSGSVGVTKELQLRWEDNKGNTGVLDIGGDTYTAGEPVAFDSGLSLVLGEGSIFETDSFTFRTFSPVIQPPQDAEIRLGATELGGGLLVTNSTNTLEDVIDGVRLNLLATDEKPVIISIKGDTEKALAGIGEFVKAYNDMLAYFQEITKYDQETGEAGPLQGDRNLPKIQREMNKMFIDTIIGLEKDKNMLVSIGIKINRQGLIQLDEEKLTSAINDDLSQVANLFRSYGTTENSGITYLSSSEKTKISGSDGFTIDITSVATKGTFSTQQYSEPITINDVNNKIYVNVNGRESEAITLENGTLSIEEIAKDLQKKIIEDKFLSKMKVAVTADNGIMSLRSNVTGSRSTVNVRVDKPENNLDHFLLNGKIVDGQNVQGSINGIELEGSGQILSGIEGTDYDGLKLFVTLSASQLGDGPEETMVFTKGVGTKVKEYIGAIMKPQTGALGIYTKTVKEQLKGYEKEVKILEERINEKREKLVQKFAKMEAKLGQLKSEQNYLTSQLAKL
jgi:flagellar capping protein FliD